MMRRFLVVLAVLTVASCSSSGGDTVPDTPSTTTPSSAVVTLDSAATTAVIGELDGDDPVGTVADPGAIDPASTDGATVSTTTRPPFVITGPATVESTVGREPVQETSTSQLSQPCAEVPRGLDTFELDAGGAVRDVRIVVPNSLSVEPAPVVLNWHGLGADGASQAVYSGYEALAEEAGFVVVHATGVAGGNSPGTSWEFDGFDDPDRDDIAFVDALIDSVVADWCGDPARVYSTGMSNGGFFTASLVCHLADRIAAAVAVGGLAHPDGCTPTRPVPFLAFHGTDDDIVPFDGNGRSPLVGIVSDEFFSNDIAAEFAQFAATNGCAVEPSRVEETAEAIRYDYLDCADGVPMTFYELPGSGHTWPNSPTADGLPGGDFHTSDVDATVDGWEFLRQHFLD
ncbi:MAG: prolyl oligopeptidase family serine peptidase [Ilumatobacter sp.]|uniref:alpha/beta hydrolase family esterase n=1 Tax=Ilumatobacter sp. TaxID=1967498 RepID=UPI003918C37B